MSNKENRTKSATVNSAVTNEIEEVPSSSKNQVKTPSLGLEGGKRPTGVPPGPPMGIEAESSCDTTVSAAALLAVRTNWTQLLNQLEGLNTTISGFQKRVTEARKGLKKYPYACTTKNGRCQHANR